MAPPGFFYHPRMLGYDLGPNHPLKPERLARTIALLRVLCPELVELDPGIAEVGDIRRVHSQEYIDAVWEASNSPSPDLESLYEWGLGTGDTPVFRGMFEASLAYCAGGIRAAEMVRDGAPLAFNMAGGLHHAQRSNASGFCVFNDPAISVAILRENVDRVAYVDIDLHHGDGVQAIFHDDPTVLTYSIHQSGRTLYPGTGFEHETGANLTSINMPLLPKTTGEVWLKGFLRTIELAFDHFQPQAVVLQMGCDPHFNDPLGHLEVRVEDWLAAVKWIKERNLPTVACGGGGYRISNVPRMWAAAVLTLTGLDVPQSIPESIPPEWGMTTFLDGISQDPYGEDEVDRLIRYWESALAKPGR